MREEMVQSLLTDLQSGRISRRGFLRGALLLGLSLPGAMGLLSACAPRGTLTPEVEPTSPPGAPTPTSAPAMTPTSSTEGGTMVVAQEIDPTALDPWTSTIIAARLCYEHTYESLLRWDPDMNPLPALAESWELMPDGLTWVFQLREGVKWHDGSDFIAEDVRYTVSRWKDPTLVSGHSDSWLALERAEVVDDHTVKLIFDRPMAHVLELLASQFGTVIIKRGSAEEINLAVEMNGTGPFKLVEYLPQSHLEFVRNDAYWDDNLPYLDGFRMPIMIEEDTRIAGLRTGSVNLAELSPEGAMRLEGEENVVVQSGPKAWLVHHVFNQRREPLDDVRVRKALVISADYQDIIDKVASGAGVVTGPLPTGYADWYIPPEELPYGKPDIDKAKELLAEAGYPNGFKTTIKASPQYPDFLAASIVLSEQWKKVGVEAEVVQVEWGQLMKELKEGGGFDYDIYASAIAHSADPLDLMDWLYPTDATFSMGWNNSEFDTLMEKAVSELDHEKRREIVLELQQMILDDAVVLFDYLAFGFTGLTSNVQDYRRSASGMRTALRQTWLRK